MEKEPKTTNSKTRGRTTRHDDEMGRTKKISRKRPRQRSPLDAYRAVRGGSRGDDDGGRQQHGSLPPSPAGVRLHHLPGHIGGGGSAVRERSSAAAPSAASAASADIVSIASSSVVVGSDAAGSDEKEDQAGQPEHRRSTGRRAPSEVSDGDCDDGTRQLDIANSSAVRALLSERSRTDRSKDDGDNNDGVIDLSMSSSDDEQDQQRGRDIEHVQQQEEEEELVQEEEEEEEEEGSSVKQLWTFVSIENHRCYQSKNKSKKKGKGGKVDDEAGGGEAQLQVLWDDHTR